MTENGSIDLLEPILGISIVGDLNFTWLFLDVGQQNCGKGGEHIRIFRYTRIHTSDFSRNVRTNCLTLDLRGKSTLGVSGEIPEIPLDTISGCISKF